jgi:hypothetical protein
MVAAAYDDRNLYLTYELKNPAEWVNAVLDPQIIFKGGNLIDLQLAPQPDADPRSQEPAAGEVRVRVTRQQDKPVAVLFRPKTATSTGDLIVLKSPTGEEAFAVITPTDRVGLDSRRTTSGFTAVVTIPRDLIGWTNVEPGRLIRMDVGYLFGDSTGTRCAQRACWSNNSPTANIIDDIPNESRLEPDQWGNALVEWQSVFSCEPEPGFQNDQQGMAPPGTGHPEEGGRSQEVRLLLTPAEPFLKSSLPQNPSRGQGGSGCQLRPTTQGMNSPSRGGQGSGVG